MLKIHEHDVDRIKGTATLVRVNPSRDYGWNPEWDGKNSDKKEGETLRIIAQRPSGSDTVSFFTGDGTPFEGTVPEFIRKDLEKHPLISETEGAVDTIAICKVCADPIPASMYPGHLERHLEEMTSPDPVVDEKKKSK